MINTIFRTTGSLINKMSRIIDCLTNMVFRLIDGLIDAMLLVDVRVLILGVTWLSKLVGCGSLVIC